ncbi:MAG: PEP-CTERM sorting domain-containing protein [Sedimentisphaerales bacterium]
MAIASSASASTQLFFDDFTGTALDTSKWSVFVDAHGQYHWPYVANGLLYSQGYHTRIDSPAFAAPETGQSVMASARISLTGDDQKFGFAPNPGERTCPIGYYFDTVDASVGSQVDHVRALAYDGSTIPLLDFEISVTWGVDVFHEFAIERTPSQVIYSIDGHEVKRVTDAFAGALPVGLWSDKGDLMQTDWVEVSQVPEPATLLLIGLGGLFLRKRKA